MPEVDIHQINNIARGAGDEILKIYNNSDFSGVVDFKDDQSPLTLADKASHDYIVKQLHQHFPDIPVISEEGNEVDYDTRKAWEYFWLVDPLDGTKEFIKRNGQFTVNIALIHKNKPVLGVIYTPVTEELYFGATQKLQNNPPGEIPFAFKQVDDREPIRLKVNNRQSERVAVRSSSHPSDEEEAIFANYDVVKNISKGSSLKFCMIAEGEADIYYRHGPTMEWDTAAGQAIVEAAGGKVYKGTGNEEFTYNKTSMLNESFLGVGFS